MLKIHHTGDFTSPLETRYRFAEINWFDLVDSDMFSMNRLIG